MLTSLFGSQYTCLILQNLVLGCGLQHNQNVTHCNTMVAEKDTAAAALATLGLLMAVHGMPWIATSRLLQPAAHANY